jgi:uncharacterized RmlC-like cupin family protein
VVSRVTKGQWLVGPGQNDSMERAVAISATTTGARGIYSSVVTTAPGGRTRIHHHGDCETSIYVESGRARYTWGPTGVEQSTEAEQGDFVYIPAGEVHVEANASDTEPLVVVLTRDCPEAVVFYLDDEPGATER